jgi:predicted ATP-grasp superfamily ATP-dependent carboligase
MMLPAVVLSAHTIGLGVIRSLGSMGVPVRSIYYETNDMGHVSRYVAERRYFCHPEWHEQEFIERLLAYSKACEGALLVPADDITLGVLSRHKELLSQHYLVACPELSVTKTFLDKKYTYAIAESIGVPAPRTLRVDSDRDLEEIADTLGFPCVIKPCQSQQYFAHFRKKLVEVHNFPELAAAYREAEQNGFEVLAQEFIPCPDTDGVNYNCYFWDGEPLVEFTAAKVRLSPPVYGLPRVVVSRPIDGVLEEGRKILKAMGFYGYACTEFKRDSRDGVYKLMEVNGRHNRSCLLAVACGINFPWIEYMHLVHGQKPASMAYRDGVYWIDEFRDCMHSIKYFGREGCSIRGYFLPYFREHVFAVYDPQDPKPFLKRCVDMVKMSWRAIGRLAGSSLQRPGH